MILMPKNSIPYEEVKSRALAKPGVKEAYDELEPAYQLACLRIASGLTQAELAERAGVPQPNIARLESGKHQPTLELLRRVAEAISQVRRTRSKKSIAKL
jgi:DNA-binding XRE family transcriptional regulator